MTPRITANEVRRRYPHIIDGGNFRWQQLSTVCRWEKVGYNAGTYGWNYDVLEVMPGVCVVTGDRPIDGNLEVDLDRMREYELDAMTVRCRQLCPEYGRLRGALRRKVRNYIGKLAETADARGTGRTPARHR